MIAPEQWYDYQKQYQKYGIDMRPQTERIPRKERLAREKQARRERLSKGVVLSVGSDHKIMLSLILICVISLMMVVVMTSYAAKITYDINEIKIENGVISGEIEDLDVQKLSSTTITYVEGQAKDKLGMKSPDSKHRVYLSGIEAPEDGFADILKEKAYN
ncbi:MAG: cell division protein FtsL [Clostridia bacterium]|nr:cell division protein FtsL [Clostridia bacterium]